MFNIRTLLGASSLDASTDEESRSEPMDAQATYMFQNPNDQGSRGSKKSDNGGNGQKAGGPGAGGNGSSIIFRVIIIVVVMIVGFYLFQLFTQSSSSSSDTIEVPYSTIYQQIKDGNVQSVTFQGQDATGTFKNAITVKGKQGDHFHFSTLPNGDPTLILVAEPV